MTFQELMDLQGKHFPNGSVEECPHDGELVIHTGLNVEDITAALENANLITME